MGMLHEPECSQLLYVYQVSSYMGTERADGKHFDGQTCDHPATYVTVQ
jgi:hypothetical protein